METLDEKARSMLDQDAQSPRTALQSTRPSAGAHPETEAEVLQEAEIRGLHVPAPPQG